MVNNMTPYLEYLEYPLRGELEKILKEAEVRTNRLLKFPEEYEKVINDYLSSNCPFEWNRFEAVDESDWQSKIKRDLKQHDDLIIYSYLINDESLLIKWGIHYPLNHGGPGLALPEKRYIDLIQNARNGTRLEEQQYFYDVLLKYLRLYLTT
jgi:hypothetical protein